MTLGLVLEGAARALLLGVLVWVTLRLLRVRSPRHVWSVWTCVLVASLLMVASMRSVPMPVTIDLSQEMIRAVPRGVVKGAARHDLLQVAVMAYAAVTALLLLRLAIGLVLSARIRAQAQSLDLPGLDARISRRVASPVTFGRTILLPMVFARWSYEKQQAVLAHERAHVRWFDFHVQLLAQLHCALVWFSPFSWWLRAELRDLAEQASDEEAVATVGDRHRYAEILVDIAATPASTRLGVAMARSCDVERRIDHILQADGGDRRRLSLVAVALLTVAAVAATLVTPQARIVADAVEQQMHRVAGSGVNPRYPARAIEEKVEGWARFRITVDAAGKPTQVDLLDEQPRDYGFAENARKAVESWRFESKDGQPYTGFYKLTFRLK